MFDNSLGVTILHIMEGVKARIELRLNKLAQASSWNEWKQPPIDVGAPKIC